MQILGSKISMGAHFPHWNFCRDNKTCIDYALKAGQHQIKQFVSSWMKTNKPESMKIYLSNSADLKPFLSQSFAIPKGNNWYVNE